ncbi:hypothetical protein HMPREF2139_07290 [Prevotella denticola DNF00960]|nr:hypothetical protein HMPREF2139_07290 [Prevotella denticola DNF00960]
MQNSGKVQISICRQQETEQKKTKSTGNRSFHNHFINRNIEHTEETRPNNVASKRQLDSKQALLEPLKGITWEADNGRLKWRRFPRLLRCISLR